MKRFTMVVLVFLFLCPSAQAIPHYYSMSGTTTWLRSGPTEYYPFGWELLTVGMPFIGVFGFEVSDPPPEPTSSSSYGNRYSIPLFFSVSFGGLLNFYNNSGASILIQNDYNGTDTLKDAMELNYMGQFGEWEFSDECGIFYFTDPTGTAFNSSLIQDLPTLSDSLFSHMSIGFTYMGEIYRGFDIDGVIDTFRPIPAAVPEPSSIVFVLLGITGLAAIKRRHIQSK